ncbi:MAG: helix-turn-helix domain-containing protein [Polyangiaceae bacterium]|nr:helix-turn-helix domain-containing protein [Polyangiaceae bacterium]
MAPEEIKAAIRMRGTTLAEISRREGLTEDACRQALRRPWPRAEAAIAYCLGLAPSVLWPDRYQPRRRTARAPRRRRIES